MMSSCRNPECKNGITPGVVVTGRGTKDKPVLGQKMNWAWVRCRACKPEKGDPPFKPVARSESEITERAGWATAKIEYKPQQTATAKALSGIAASAKSSGHVPSQPPDNARLDKLLDQVSKLTEQVTELLAENRALRKQLEGGRSGVNEELAASAKPS